MSANRLAGETSSYLRSAAHQPVDWHPWGAEAFERAHREDKPVLLDVGAVWCHWCHVMDRESYEDPQLAAMLNREFVAIKVDRDERPDVDTRYQKAIQAMTGQGGWPLTAFLLPDGRPFYGGTYFPPTEAHGRPSFQRVLAAIAESYRNKRHEMLHNADTLAAHLAPAPALAPALEDDPAAVVAGAVAEMQRAFDAQEGGFGRAPKFPHASAHDFLLARGVAGDKAALDMLVATLEAMRDGGVYDQLGGGFHRYSVDREWIVPHFEKMLYDNAGLLRNYARAAKALGRADFAAVADDITRFLRDVLRQADGAFGGSQDADVDLDDDGDFFTWTLDELRAAVPEPALARLMALRYHVREAGDMHHDPRRCVLRVEADEEALAAALGRAAADVRADLARGKRMMQEARAKRKAPFVDPIRYTSWNAMAIQALLEHRQDEIALRALDAFLRGAYDPKRGFARSIGSDRHGFLDDNAQMLDALLEAHVATGDAAYLARAREVADLLLTSFAHPDGGFADRAADLAPPAESAPLAQPERPIQDAPTASPNGVALAALLRLADATGEARYREVAERALRLLAREASHLSLFGGALLLALDRLARPAPRVAVPHGEPAPYRAALRAAHAPGATFAGPDEPMPEEARQYRGDGALVCLGQRCLAPARTPEELRARLAEGVGGGTRGAQQPLSPP